MKRIAYILILLLFFLSFAGCNENELVSIQVQDFTNQSTFYNSFDIENYKLILYYENGNIEYVDITLDMMDSNDTDKLYNEGENEITISYYGVETNISFTIVKEKLKYRFDYYLEDLNCNYVLESSHSFNTAYEIDYDNYDFIYPEYKGYYKTSDYKYHMEDDIYVYDIYYDRCLYSINIYVDDEIVHSESYKYGETINLHYEPQKENYLFFSYDKTVPTVMDDFDVDLNAIFTPITFTYSFIDFDGTIIKEESVIKNSEIIAPDNPTREKDDMYTYKFSNWTNYTEGMRIDKNYVFIANYSCELNKYTVTFKNSDGTILQQVSVKYGENAIYTGVQPVHPSSPQYIFTFIGWDKNLNNIKSDLEVFAEYDKTDAIFLVNIEVDGVSNIKSVKYGDDIELPSDPVKIGYTFIGWNHSGKNITQSMTIKAIFKVNSYNVNYYVDGVRYKTIPMEFGTPIEFEEYIVNDDYLFTGWSCNYVTVPANDCNVYGYLLNISAFNEPYSGNKKELKYSNKLNVLSESYKYNNFEVEEVVNSGSYFLELKYLINDEEHIFTYEFLIDKADSIITVEDLYVTYDGNIHNLKYHLNHNETEVICDSTGYINAGVYLVNLYVEESENYKAVSINKKIIIDKAIYDLSNISFPDVTYSYDGYEKVVEISGVMPDGLSVCYENNKLTNAGNVTAIAKFEGDFDNFMEIDDWNCILSITPKKAIISIDDKSSIYGEELQGFTYTYSGFIGDISINICKEDGLNVGKYILSTDYFDDNYDITINEGIYTIEKATYDISNISFNNQTLTYDGIQKEITILGTLPDGVTVNYMDNKIIDVGTIYPTAIFTGDYNNYYEISNMECVINVIKKNVTITIDNIISAYGEDLLPFTYEATGICDRDDVKVIITKEDGLEVGDYLLTGIADHPNYNITFVNAKYKITYIDFIGLEFNNKTVIYDGNGHSIEVDGLKEGLSVVYLNESGVEVENYEKIAAGTYEITAIVSSINFDEKEILKATLTIDRKDALIMIDNTESVYGESFVPFSYKTEGFIEEISPLIVKEEGNDAGIYQLTTDYNNDNYNITIVNGLYQILKAESKITMSSQTDLFMYTGNEIFLEAKLNHSETSINYVNNNMIEVGNYTLIAECAESKNYLSAKLTFNYSIKFAVSFYDSVGNIIYRSYVLNGANAKFEGELPVKNSDYQYNYEFISWDRDYNNVSSNLDVKPLFAKTDVLYNVLYKDVDNNIILKYSDIIYDTPLEEPNRIIRLSMNRDKSYVFNMWDVLNYHNSVDNLDGTRTLIIYPIYFEVEAVAMINNNYYGSVVEAINNSKNGDIITLLSSNNNELIIDEDCTIKEGVTLYLPYSEGVSLNNANGDNEGGKFSKNDKYLSLKIKDCTLNVLGEIIIGAVTGYTSYGGSNYLQGNINGKYSEISLYDNSSIIVGDGIAEASITCYGMIVDNSVTNKANIVVNKNSVISENFVIYDWKGGTYLLNNFYVNKKVAPFNRYQLPYITVETKFMSGSKYKGIGKVFVSIDGTDSEFTGMPFIIIGSEIDVNSGKMANGLFTLNDDQGYVIKKFSDVNDVAVNSYTDNLQFIISGSAKINSLTIVFNNSLYSTNYVSFPIPYGLSIFLNNCELEINNLFKILPGGKIVIDENSSVLIKDYDTTDSYLAGLSVYDNYNYSNAPQDVYPSASQLESSGHDTSGILINNGQIIIDSLEIWIGGSVTGTGKIVKNYPCNKGIKGEIPEATSTSYRETYLTLYFNGKEIVRSYTGIYE